MKAPALRDQYGQEWPFPPIEGPGSSAHDKTWLIFIPGAYTPVCMSELDQVGEISGKLAELEVGLRLIAPDSAPVLRPVSDQLELAAPFCLTWPHRAAAQYYGSLITPRAAATREPPRGSFREALDSITSISESATCVSI